jgi:hypothetical protein
MKRDYALRPAYRRLANGTLKAIAPDVVEFEVVYDDGRIERVPYMPDLTTHQMTDAALLARSRRLRRLLKPPSSWPYRAVVHDKLEYERLMARGYFAGPGRQPVDVRATSK